VCSISKQHTLKQESHVLSLIHAHKGQLTFMHTHGWQGFFQRIYDAFDSKSRVEDIKAEFFCMLKAEILGLKTLGLISVDTKYEPGNT
jgi:hypothetical protein